MNTKVGEAALEFVDISGDERIPVFMKMVRELGQAKEPEEALNAFLKALARAHNWFSYIHVACMDCRDGEYRIVRFVDQQGQEVVERHAFVTAFFAIYYPKTRELRYVCAGHDAPILMQPGEAHKMKRLDAVSGFPLGVSEKVGSKEAMIVLETGQSLVLYTDGITEALSPDGEMFRVEGIEKALISCNGQPDCVILEVVDALKTHEAGGRAKDDQTLVALHVEDLPDN